MIDQPSVSATPDFRSPRGRIGHVNLKVADLARSLAFYQGVLGMKITKRIGEEAAFLSFDDYHHDICINTWESRNGPAPAAGTTGLFHAAIVYEGRDGLVQVYRRLAEQGISIDQAVDHGVTESLYLRDPDGNPLELYWDRTEETWFSEEGDLKMYFTRIDPEQLPG